MTILKLPLFNRRSKAFQNDLVLWLELSMSRINLHGSKDIHHIHASPGSCCIKECRLCSDLDTDG